MKNHGKAGIRTTCYKVIQRFRVTGACGPAHSLNMSITSFYGDAPRIWNKAPREITKAKSLAIAKKEIRIFCKTLPI